MVRGKKGIGVKSEKGDRREEVDKSKCHMAATNIGFQPGVVPVWWSGEDGKIIKFHSSVKMVHERQMGGVWCHGASPNDGPLKCLKIVTPLLLKATFSVHKLIPPKNAQMITLYTNWSLYTTFTMIYSIRQD